MVRYRVELTQAVRDIVRHLPPQLKQRVKAAVRVIAQDPLQAKALKDELAGLYSYRIGRMRLIFRIVPILSTLESEDARIEVVSFGPRRDIYERAAAEFSTTARQQEHETSTIPTSRKKPQ
jgi:mRNA interferase RelE/StbE